MPAAAPKGKRCGCRDESGRLLGSRCPKLRQRHHGKYVAELRIDTTAGRRKLHRSGFDTATDRDDFTERVRDLIKLARGDKRLEARIGDVIWEQSRQGGQLPETALVARRLGLQQDPGGSGVTCAEAWNAWLAGKRKLRESSRRNLDLLGRHWILPVIDGVPLEQFGGQHCADVFARIDRINAEITAQRAEGRAEISAAGDVRQVQKVIGNATMHRVYAALQGWCTFEVRVTHRLPFNPVYVVELEPEVTPEADHYTAAEARRFLAACEGDPLGLMFRVAVLRGTRRGELVGFRWAASDLEAGYLGVEKTILQLGGRIAPQDQAKTKSSKREVWLDAGTLTRVREHRKAQLAARLRAGELWQDNDLVFCREDGSPWPPDYVSRRFKEIAAAAGLRVVALKDGTRHTAPSLARTAGVDTEIRRKTLGHASAEMTSHYTHVEAEAHRRAAEDVAALVREAGS